MGTGAPGHPTAIPGLPEVGNPRHVETQGISRNTVFRGVFAFSGGLCSSVAKAVLSTNEILLNKLCN